MAKAEIELVSGWTGWNGRHPVTYRTRCDAGNQKDFLAQHESLGEYYNFSVEPVSGSIDSERLRSLSVFPNRLCSRYRGRFNVRLIYSGRARIHARISRRPSIVINGFRMPFHPYALRNVVGQPVLLEDTSDGGRMMFRFCDSILRPILAVGICYLLLQLKDGS